MGMTQDNKELLLKLLQKYKELGISEQIDYKKFYLYSIITHSTAIEGSIKQQVDNFNENNHIQFSYDEFLGAVAGHEIEHLSQENLKINFELKQAKVLTNQDTQKILDLKKRIEEKPNQIRHQILQEVLNSKYKEGE